eukprot:14081247-Alexandrium_andersonii.AAC.1
MQNFARTRLGLNRASIGSAWGGDRERGRAERTERGLIGVIRHAYEQRCKTHGFGGLQKGL